MLDLIEQVTEQLSVQDPEARANEPKWRIWERAAAELEASYPDCHVILDHKAVGRRSGIERQIDVWVTGTVGPHQVNIAVECKCLRQRVSIKDIEAFYRPASIEKCKFAADSRGRV
jgi:hypothetical protein